jgi:hypothetical protein
MSNIAVSLVPLAIAWLPYYVVGKQTAIKICFDIPGLGSFKIELEPRDGKGGDSPPEGRA